MEKNVNYNKGLIFELKVCQQFEIKKIRLNNVFKSQFLPRRKQYLPLQSSNDKDVKYLFFFPTNIK